MRRACLLLTALLLTGCGFEEPPPPAPDPVAEPVISAPAVAPAQVDDPCTDVALTLLDGQLNGVPSADPAILQKAEKVVEQFVARYDAVIVSAGVEAARAQYTDEIRAACAG